MKRVLAMTISCLFFQIGFAQKNEFIMGVGATASFFRGISAASTSSIFISDLPGTIPNRTRDYYGKKTGVGANAELTVQHIGKKRFITGLSIAFEILKSKVKITEVNSRLRTPADGTTIMKHTFINLFPYIGKRFGGEKFAFDINLGLDIGLPLSAHEKGEARTGDGIVYTTDTDRSKPSVDLRPRLQFKVQKRHFGIQTSYAIGQTEYFGHLIGSDPEAYSNVFRLGVFHIL